MPTDNAAPLTAFTANLLDVLAQARSADEALTHADTFRKVVAGEGLFSIQQNVTTDADPADEIRLRRFYSSQGERFPVQAAKRKTLTPWTECLFVQGRVFVGEGEEVLARTFDDHEQMRPFGIRSVVNVPLLQGNVTYATFNVFGPQAQWQPHEVLGIRLLALAVARWVPRAPHLSYRFTGIEPARLQEA
jgi:hypothetical protein